MFKFIVKCFSLAFVYAQKINHTFLYSFAQTQIDTYIHILITNYHDVIFVAKFFSFQYQLGI